MDGDDGDGYVIPLSEGAAAFAAEHPVPRDRKWERSLYGVYQMIVLRTSPYARFDLRERYYDRGVRLWPAWADPGSGFERFGEAARLWQKGLQFDRVDNVGGYAPGNLRLVTPRENNRHRSNTVRVEDPRGEHHHLKDLAEELGLSYGTVRSRHRQGADWDELTAPPRSRQEYTVEGSPYTMGELYAEARARGSLIKYWTLHRRVRSGDDTWERLLRPVLH